MIGAALGLAIGGWFVMALHQWLDGCSPFALAYGACCLLSFAAMLLLVAGI